MCVRESLLVKSTNNWGKNPKNKKRRRRGVKRRLARLVFAAGAATPASRSIFYSGGLEKSFRSTHAHPVSLFFTKGYIDVSFFISSFSCMLCRGGGCLFPSRRDSAVVVLVGNWMMDLVHIEIRLHSFFRTPYFCVPFFSFFKMMLSKSSYDVHLKMAPGKDDIWSPSSQGEKKKASKKYHRNEDFKCETTRSVQIFILFFSLLLLLLLEWVGLIPSWEDVNPVRDGNAPSGRQRQKATWKQVELEWKR